MFPYIETRAWPFAPFSALVAIGIAVGYLVALHRARMYGIGREQFTKLGVLVVACAFIGGHLAKFFYISGGLAMIMANPWILLNLFQGQASLGCFIGGYLGALAFLRWNSVPYPDWYLYADVAAYAVPCAWWIGRVGCYLVHDHPGIRTTSWLGVDYPGGRRFDLGLIEVLFLLLLAAVFVLLGRKPRPRGFFYTAFMLCYGLFRVWLDHLHVDPPRYYGWTVDQIAAGVMLVGAVIATADLMRLKRAGRLREMSTTEVA